MRKKSFGAVFDSAVADVPENEDDHGSASAGTDCDSAAEPGETDGVEDGDDGEQGGVFVDSAAGAADATDAGHQVNEAEDAEDDK